MGKLEDMVGKIQTIVKTPVRIRNMAIAAHIDHGKTTLSDSLLAGAGMISEELAGSQLFMDFDKQEQERGITIYAANASMVHDYNGVDYLINLIDTPGHVDFGGDVTRAMRAVDGALVLCCSVDGVMPQTETVLRQALRERVKPVLFINKVDRLINELKLTPEQMQQRFIEIINKVNVLIKKYAPPEFKEKWLVDVNTGRVAFGSAYKKWAISIPSMKKTGLTFKDVITMTLEGKEAELSKRSPLHRLLLDMVITHLPSPIEAQVYRIPKIWTGDTATIEGKAMLGCSPLGDTIGVITNVSADPHAGLVSTVRLFSGKIHRGDNVYIVGKHVMERAQQIGVYMGPKRVPMDELPAGNIVAITGLTESATGETICNPENIIAPFESIKYTFEPVVTKSIEVKNVNDLPKLITIMKQRAREDQTLRVKISEETGEMLVSGLGELHIEAKVEIYLKERGLEIIVSKPIVIYKEGVKKESPEVEGKSPNKHNKFYMKIVPMDKQVHELVLSEGLKEGKVRQQDKKGVHDALVGAGFDNELSKKVVDIYNGNMLINASRGVQYLNEVMELMVQAFHEVCDTGPLANEPATGINIMVMDAKLHEDAIHRGPAQVLPAVRDAIKNAMLYGGAAILEPKQIIRIDTPTERMGNVMTEVQNRRGQIMEMSEEQGVSIIKAKLPVAEMFGFEAGLKSATGGRGFQSLIDIVYEFLPMELQNRTILQIRKRKGMKEEIPQPTSE